MKRTRRVEVIRYRRSTVIGNEASQEPDLAAERVAIDLLLDTAGADERPVEEPRGAEHDPADGVNIVVVQRRRPLGFLKRLFRR